MSAKKRTAAGATTHNCPICHQKLGPMTDAQRRENMPRHERSLRHLRYASLNRGKD